MSEKKLSLVVLDIETTVKDDTDNSWGKANPFNKGNYTVALGKKEIDKNKETEVLYVHVTSGTIGNLCSFDNETEDLNEIRPITGLNATVKLLSKTVFIGHNLAFDLLYLLPVDDIPYMFSDDLTRQRILSFFKNMYVYDTQLATYAMSGQAVKYSSLENSSDYFNIPTLKDGRFKLMWNNGVQTEDINPAMLCRYLLNDIEETAILFETQQDIIQKNYSHNFRMNLHVSNEALLSTVFMSAVGMKVSKSKLAEEKAELLLRNDHAITSVNKVLDLMFGGACIHMDTENASSRQYISDIFFSNIGGRLLLEPSDVGAKLSGNSTNIYNVDDKVLKNIIASGGAAAHIAKDILEIRSNSKLINSFIDPIFQDLDDNNYYHPKLSSVQTVTGRLAGFAQTIPNNPMIKESFVAPEGWLWGSIDFSQIEIVCAAILSGDKQLIADLIGGVDIHKELFYSLHKRHHTPAERKAFKRVVFAMLYGAAPYTAHQQLEDSTLTLHQVKQIYKGFQDKYPDVIAFPYQTASQIYHSATYNGLKDVETGLPCREATIDTVSGKKLYYREYPLSAFRKSKTGKDTDFSPTQVKNYKYQALAADIMKIFLMKVFRAVVSGELPGIIPIMTTHDSLDFYIKDDDVLSTNLTELQQLASGMGTYLKELYQIDTYGLPFKTEISTGNNWSDQTVWENE